MVFTDICIITKNVLDLAKFYNSIFNMSCELDSIHCYIIGPGLNIAIYDQGAAESDGMDFTNAGRNYTYIGFNVDDVDAEYERLKLLNVDILSEPKLWPWGAKSFSFHDPDGNMIVFRSWPQQS
jgi:predicted enzyme related to lactoylglutathione lyase